MIVSLLHTCAVLMLLIVVAMLASAVVWVYIEAVSKIISWFRFNRTVCEYFVHRKWFKVWLDKNCARQRCTGR